MRSSLDAQLSEGSSCLLFGRCLCGAHASLTAPVECCTCSNNETLSIPNADRCLQDLWGRCAGRNKEDAATLVEGLSVLQLRQVAERSQVAALEAAQARVQQLEARLAAAQVQPAPATAVLAQVAATTAWPLSLPAEAFLEVTL